jgi:hypothetical protein
MHAYFIKVGGDRAYKDKRVDDDEKFQKIIVEADACSRVKQVSDNNI